MNHHSDQNCNLLLSVNTLLLMIFSIFSKINFYLTFQMLCNAFEVFILLIFRVWAFLINGSTKYLEIDPEWWWMLLPPPSIESLNEEVSITHSACWLTSAHFKLTQNWIEMQLVKIASLGLVRFPNFYLVVVRPMITFSLFLHFLLFLCHTHILCNCFFFFLLLIPPFGFSCVLRIDFAISVCFLSK